MIRGVAIGEGRGAGVCHGPPHFNFQTKQGPKVAVSNISDIAFYECSEIIGTRNFTTFTVYATIFGQFNLYGPKDVRCTSATHSERRFLVLTFLGV